jgi:hypothetical protein
VLLGALLVLAAGVIVFLRYVIRTEDALVSLQEVPAMGENPDLGDTLADGGEAANS